MNPNSLSIYSFLMRESIPFVRYCHPAYVGLSQWHSRIKKAKTEVLLPQTAGYYDERTQQFVLLLHAEKSDWQQYAAQHKLISPSQQQRESLSEILRCPEGIVSVLGIYFDTEKKCRPVLDKELFQQEKLLCLCPCSNTSSVFLKADALTKQFFPALGIEPDYDST